VGSQREEVLHDRPQEDGRLPLGACLLQETLLGELGAPGVRLALLRLGQFKRLLVVGSQVPQPLDFGVHPILDLLYAETLLGFLRDCSIDRPQQVHHAPQDPRCAGRGPGVQFDGRFLEACGIQGLVQHPQDVALGRRAVQLHVAAEIARDATTARELNVLLNRAVTLVSERFGYYHAGIFFINDTENGTAVSDVQDKGGLIKDTERVDYLRSHITQVQKAVTSGIPIKGYFVWSLMDNMEWAEGYSKRFGITYVDYSTLKRTLKESALFYSEVIRNNGL